jgi:hypothetical protein
MVNGQNPDPKVKQRKQKNRADAAANTTADAWIGNQQAYYCNPLLDCLRSEDIDIEGTAGWIWQR